MECSPDGLVLCNGTLTYCDGHVLACADSEVNNNYKIYEAFY